MSDLKPQSANQLFDQLREQYYSSWFRFHPENGIAIGDASVSECFRSYSEDDIGALLALNKKLTFALAELDIEDLDETRRVDYRLMLGATEIEIRDQEEHDWRYRDPNYYVPVNAIYQLLIHPAGNVQRAIKRRLEVMPEHLRGAKLQLKQSPADVVPIWLDSAIKQCKIGVPFIRNLVRHPIIKKHFSNPARLQPLCDTAAKSLEEFSGFLENEIRPQAQGEFASGEERFNRLLNSKHFLGVNHEELLSLGERLFEETTQLLIEQTKMMTGKDDVAGLLQNIQKKHLPKEKLLEGYRKRMREAYKWLAKSDLLELPETQSLKIQETPSFMKALIPFAAYEPPAPNDPEQHGLYYVTIADEDISLAEHNNFSIDLTCIHEAFPGHHLQFVLSNRYQKNNVTRSINKSASMYEGWALYCEDLAVEQKFLNKKEHVFMMLRDRLWRALRIIIDVKIQTGQLTIEQAVDLMTEKLGLERSQAESELGWYSRLPTSPSCYAVGRELIMAARKQCVNEQGMELKTFHDELLKQGSIALPLAIHEAFGAEVWQHVHADVFGARE